MTMTTDTAGVTVAPPELKALEIRNDKRSVVLVRNESDYATLHVREYTWLQGQTINRRLGLYLTNEQLHEVADWIKENVPEQEPIK